MPLIHTGLRRYTAGVAFAVFIGSTAVPVAAQQPVAPLAPQHAVVATAVSAAATDSGALPSMKTNATPAV